MRPVKAAPSSRRSGNRKRLLVAIAGGLVAVAALIVGSLAWVFVPFASHWGIETEERVIALTFDDGPYPPYTNRLLDLLAAARVPATFFVTGEYATAHPEIVRRALADGHQIGNHSWNGDVLAWVGPGGVRDRIARTDEALEALGVPSPVAFRAPKGMPGPFASWHVWRQGRRQIGGTAGANDWLRPDMEEGDCVQLGTIELMCPTQNPDEIVARVLSTLAPGGIVVLHDGFDAAPGADRSGTVTAVGRLIAELRTDGYAFVTVDELLARIPG